MSEPVYLGFDLSTQQLKCLAISSQLKVVNQAKFDFDADSHGFDIEKGVLVNPGEGEVYAPVALWLQALDSVLQRMKEDGLDLKRVRGICGSGMQHGCAFWNHDASRILSSLDPARSLEEQLGPALAHPDSPNWQDASTTAQCEEFNRRLGSPQELARQTGSKAHHRFTGPQIMRFRQKYPDHYKQTARISLVSSWIATVFLGKYAPFDISDACGMNLRNVRAGIWNEELLELVADGEKGVGELMKKLGDVPEDGGATFGQISPYFVQRHGFDPSCKIIASTGDNPATILSLPLRENDAIVSLGTSSTFLMVTPEYKPDPAYHFFNSPTTAGLYMFMLCYKNGGLARENVRNAINSQNGVSKSEQNTWQHFDKALSETAPLARKGGTGAGPMNLGIYFPRHEIVPDLPKGEWHFEYNPDTKDLKPIESTPKAPHDDARIIVESQFLSMRLRSRNIVKIPSSSTPDIVNGDGNSSSSTNNNNIPAQPRRIYLVGGGSRNRAIAKLCGQILGGSEGVYKLDVGENACALGAAHKAVWGVERKVMNSGQNHGGKVPHTESFEDFIEARWNEDEFVEKIADGYQKEYFDLYGQALEGFELMEQRLLESINK